MTLICKVCVFRFRLLPWIEKVRSKASSESGTVMSTAYLNGPPAISMGAISTTLGPLNWYSLWPSLSPNRKSAWSTKTLLGIATIRTSGLLISMFPLLLTRKITLPHFLLCSRGKSSGGCFSMASKGLGPAFVWMATSAMGFLDCRSSSCFRCASRRPSWAFDVSRFLVCISCWTLEVARLLLNSSCWTLDVSRFLVSISCCWVAASTTACNCCLLASKLFCCSSLSLTDFW